MRIPAVTGAVLAALLLASAGGCGQNDPKKHPLYLKGLQLRDEGNPLEAETYLKRYVEKEPDSPHGHLALASLYDEALNHPTAALYHYDEYLRLAPKDDPDRPTVENYRLLTRAKLLKLLSGEPLEDDISTRIIEAEVYQMVNDAFEELSTPCRRVYSASLEGKSQKEIAAQYDITINTVKKHINNANHYLRDRLRRFLGLPEKGEEE